MPERIIARLAAGKLPEPILVIPSETWDTFELTGERGEFIIAYFVAARSSIDKREDTFSIKRESKCKTKKYIPLVGGKGTGILVPKEISQQFGLRMSHYLEVVLKKVIKNGREIDIFPGRDVFEHYPRGFQV